MRMFMKKILLKRFCAVAVLAAMITSLTACGNSAGKLLSSCQGNGWRVSGVGRNDDGRLCALCGRTQLYGCRTWE